MNEPLADPPLERRQVTLRGAMIGLTAACLLLALVRQIAPEPEQAVFGLAMATFVALLVGFLLRRAVVVGLSESPFASAWFGTVAGGGIFGAFLAGTAFDYESLGSSLALAALATLIGMVMALWFSALGLFLAILVGLLVRSRSAWIIGPVCGGTTGFACGWSLFGATDSPQPAVAIAAMCFGGASATYTALAGERVRKQRHATIERIRNGATPPVIAPPADLASADEAAP